MPQCLACSRQTDSFYTASVCSLLKGEEEEQQRGGRREGWENKASIVVSPARPARAALAGATGYVMPLAGPTSLFWAAAHTNPHWGTSPALEGGEGIEGELWENQWRRCDNNNFCFLSATNRKHADTPPIWTHLLKDTSQINISTAATAQRRHHF